MKLHKLFIFLPIFSLFLSAPFSFAEDPIKKDFKEAGHEMKEGFKTTGHGIKKGAKKTGKAFKSGGKAFKNEITK